MGDANSNDKMNDQTIPVSILSALPSLHEPCILSQLDQNDEIKRLTTLIQSTTSKPDTPLSFPISDTELQITAMPIKHLLQPSNDQSNKQTNNQTSNLYWSWHDPTHSHSSIDSINQSTDQSINSTATDDPEYRDYLLSQLSHSRNVLTNLTVKKVRVNAHIDALHRYNELKDIGQTLLGKLAEQQGCMTRDMYPKYDLDLED